MRRALIASILGVMLLGSDGAAARVYISPKHCPAGTGATHDPFYDVTATQGRLTNRGRSTALQVRGRYRATENSGTWELNTVRYRSHSRMLDLELRRSPGPRLRNPPCVNFSGSFTNGNPLDVRITDSKGRRITLDVHRPSGASPRH
jgi:hypothetical protein